MRLLQGAALALSAFLAEAARADVHCYVFRNDAPRVTTLSFTYSPTIGNVVTAVAIDPGKTYPFDGRPWCWNLPGDTSAFVAVAAPGSPGWSGQLVLGNGPETADSGTYVVSAATSPAAAAPPAHAATVAIAPAAAAQTCLPNSYPNGSRYCLTALQSGVQLRCNSAHTGRSGVVSVDRLSLTCPNGQKVKLTCMNVLGGQQQCELYENRLCTNDYPRSAADFCPKGSGQR